MSTQEVLEEEPITQGKWLPKRGDATVDLSGLNLSEMGDEMGAEAS